MSQLSTAQLQDALETRKEIDRLETRLAIILSGGTVNPLRAAPAPPPRRAAPKRKTTAAPAPRPANGANDARLSASAAARPMRKNLSVESRLRISAAAKARWASRKAAGKNKL